MPGVSSKAIRQVFFRAPGFGNTNSANRCLNLLNGSASNTSFVQGFIKQRQHDCLPVIMANLLNYVPQSLRPGPCHSELYFTDPVHLFDKSTQLHARD